MGPRKTLDGAALRANVAAFAALGAPVAAVLKHDGYGWGARRIAHEIDGVVDSYIVNEYDELADLREATQRPVRMLSDAASGALEATLALDAIPNVSTCDALAEARHAARLRGGCTVRIGVCDAAGWNAIAPREIDAFADACAGSELRVEVWSHVTAPDRLEPARRDLQALQTALEQRGVTIAGSDLASTASAQRGDARSLLRIGAGLFGASLGNGLALRCAVGMAGRVVRRWPAGSHRWAGYGHVSIPADVPLAVVRCGYGDGLPRTLVGHGGILAMGMQFLTRIDGEGDEAGDLMNPATSLDEMAASAGITAHELVVGLA